MKNSTKILCVLLSTIIALGLFTIVLTDVSAATIESPIGVSDCVHESTYSIKRNYVDYGDRGSYDIVTYCFNCGQELSHEYKEVPISADEVIYFDAASAGWDDTSYVSFYICEIDGSELMPWGSTLTRGKRGENDIWYYNTWMLDLTEEKEYYIMFAADNGAQTYPLLFNTSCFGHTASCNGTRKESPWDPIKSFLNARWYNDILWRGVCGNCTWSINENVLTISGNGKMENLNFCFNSYPSIWSMLDITEAVIDDGVTAIGRNAFAECTKLEKITIGNSVKSIGKSAFNGCKKLTEVTLSDSVEIIGSYAFCDCSTLSNVNISDSVTDIGEYVFYNCPNLKSVTIPDSVTNIDTKAFGYYWDEEFEFTRRVPGFTIYGNVGSDAQRYAKAYGFQFERAIAMVGDADGDCQVTVMDVSEVQRTLSKVNTITEDDITKYVDIDQNSVINIIDATYILRSVANIPIPYEVGKIMDNK